MFTPPQLLADVTRGDTGAPWAGLMSVDALTVDVLNVDVLNVDVLNIDVLNIDVLNVDVLNVDVLTTGSGDAVIGSTLIVVLLALRIALAVVFVAMGVLHFVPRVARGMRAMIPPALRRPGWPSPAALVALTGVCEIAGGLGLVAPWPEVRAAAGVALAVFLVAVFPANAYAAQHPERFGRVAVPLIPRLVAQVVLIALVLVAGLARP